MKAVSKIFSSIGLAIMLLALVIPSVRADQGQLSPREVRVNGYPNVTIRFTATTSDGLPFAGLTEQNIRVFEDGVDQGRKMVYPLSQTPTPLAVVLAIDTSGSMQGEPLTQAKSAAKAFISELRSQDKLALVSFNQSVTLNTPFSSVKGNLDRNALTKTIDGLTAKGDTKLYDAAYRAVSEAGKVEGNRVVVILTDGEDTLSDSRLDQAIDLAKEKNVPLYTIGLGQAVAVPVLQKFAEQTGGRYYFAPTPQDLAFVFRLLSNQLHNEYEMYYNSSTELPVGSTVHGKMVITNPGQPDLEAEFSYIVPSLVERTNNTQNYSLQEVGDGGLLSREQLEWLARIAALLMFLGTVFFLIGWVRKRRQNAVQERLGNYVQTLAMTAPERKPSVAGSVARPAAMLVGRMSSRIMPDKETSKLRQNLIYAGRPFGWRVEDFLALQVTLAIFLGVFFFIFLSGVDGTRAMLISPVAAILGFRLPNIWLGMKIRSRQSQILKALPDALDLLTISVEAGVGFDGAVMEVCQKWQNPLTEEFNVALQEIRMGRSRRDALRDLADRTGVLEVRTFISAIIQANELGVNIARTLAIQSQQMRVRRRQRAEELAQKAPIKMLIPMVFLIFPAMFVVILGPALPSLGAVFSAPK